ncbi:lipase family protein [Acinetobacter sp. YH12023]|uniref:lipase family protein n=1 Tax=Acinetobacter sp. YH12023 TaxID=2601041 RepID=UPI0015D2ABC5|nr:lipase family protein [Acinetobacter sp. YH12023]
MGLEEQAYADLVRTTMGNVNPTPPVVPVQLVVYTHSYTAFIGGASDKYSFAPNDLPINIGGRGLGPNRFVGEYFDEFDLSQKKKFKNATIEYYGYEEAYTGMKAGGKKLDAFDNIKKFLEKNPNTQVNIIGHSLGGWNAAGLAAELVKKKICKVNLLITIDPVGTLLSYSALTPVRARIYFREPSPNCNYWISVTCEPKSYDSNDAVADSGGQWRDKPRERANVFYSTKYSHAEFKEMMKEKIFMGQSAEDMMFTQLKKIK